MVKAQIKSLKSSSRPSEPDALLNSFAKAFSARLATAAVPTSTVTDKGVRQKAMRPGSAALHTRSASARPRSEQAAVVKLATDVLIDAIKEFYSAPVATFDPAVRILVEPIAKLIPEARRQQSEETIDALVRVLLPKVDPLGAVMSRIERSNAEARVKFLQTIELVPGAELGELAGHKAANKSATGTRWKGRGLVFSVPYDGKEFYPTFQFADGLPRPIISKVLAELPKAMSAWQIAFWFVSSNSFLDGAEPYRRLGDEEAVLAAAKAEAEGLVG